MAREVMQLQYPALTTFAAFPIDIRPGLAAAWTPTSDGRGFVYSLRPATWSDGRPVTAGDVVASLTRARDEDWPYADDRFDALTAVERDPMTVEVTSAAGPGALPVLPLHVFPAGDAAAGAPTSGDWHVTSQTDDEVRMSVIDRPGRPILDEIVFRSYANAAQLERALARGDVDIAAGFAPSDVTTLQAIDGVQVIHANDGDQWVLRAKVADPSIRRAVARSIDRDALVRDAVAGVGRAQSIPIVARDADWQLPAAEAEALAQELAYDPEAARDLVSAAAPNAAEVPVRLTLSAPDDEVANVIADDIEAALGEVGITVERTTADDADLTIVRRDPGDDPGIALTAYTCAGGVWCDASYEAAFATYAAATDVETRRSSVHTMVRTLTDAATEIVLFAPDELQAFRTDNITGILREPSDVRLVAFGASTESYGQIRAAPPVSDGELPSRTFAALTVGGLAAAGIGVFVIDRWFHARR